MRYRRRFMQFVCIMMVSFSVFIGSISSFGSSINADYLNPEIWFEDDNVKTTLLNLTSGSHSLDGVFKYFFDENDNIAYFYVDFHDSSFDEDYHTSKMEFRINDDKYVYSFDVDQNGMNDRSNNENDLFLVMQNFEFYGERDAYMVAIAIKNGSLLNKISVKLCINEHNYLILNNAVIDSRIPTTVKETKPQKTTTRKEKTTRKSGSNSKKNKGTSSVKPTKFIPSGDNIPESTEGNKATSQKSGGNSVEITKQDKTSSPKIGLSSKFNTMGFIFSALSILIMIAIVIRGIIKDEKRKKKKKKKH